MLTLSVVGSVLALELHDHDTSFTPDAVLRVATQNISIGGMYRETSLVNGSLPGPALRLQENTVAWIRVYNDMPNDNLTMASPLLTTRGNSCC